MKEHEQIMKEVEERFNVSIALQKVIDRYSYQVKLMDSSSQSIVKAQIYGAYLMALEMAKSDEERTDIDDVWYEYTLEEENN